MRLTIKEDLKQAKVTFKPEETKEAIKVATILRDTDNITLGETDRKTYICFSYNMDKEAFKKEYTAAKYMVYEGITPNNKFVALPATAKDFGHGYSTPCKYDLDAHHTIKMPEKTPQEIAEDRKVLISKNPYKYPKLLENYEVLYIEFGNRNTAQFNNFWNLLPTIFCLYTTDDLSDTIYNGHAGDYDFYDLEYFAQEVSYMENDCTDEWKIHTNGDIYLGDDLVLQHI